jgi:hypothetical protein
VIGGRVVLCPNVLDLVLEADDHICVLLHTCLIHFDMISRAEIEGTNLTGV